jgi:hypothetical protein
MKKSTAALIEELKLTGDQSIYLYALLLSIVPN